MGTRPQAVLTDDVDHGSEPVQKPVNSEDTRNMRGV